jgi:hypothetical protein
MAERIGLFSTPEEVRNTRLEEIRRLQQDNAPKGFNFGVSLGQGMRESANNILGITDPMEAKAAELQAMMQSVDPNDPTSLMQMAKMMNELGYTKEAIELLKLADQRQKSVSEAQAAETKKAQGTTREVSKIVYRKMSIGSGDNAQIVQVPVQVRVTQRWNNEKNQWEDLVPAAAEATVGDKGYKLKDGWGAFLDPTTETTTQAPAEAKPTPSQQDNSGLDYSHWGY